MGAFRAAPRTLPIEPDRPITPPSPKQFAYGGSSLLGVVVLYFLFWPVAVDPVAWTPPEHPGFTGPYEKNKRLRSARTIPVPGPGPEDVLIDHDGRLITGLEDGRIVRLSGSNGEAVRTLANTGGRPLGLDRGPGESIYVVDAEKGLLRLDPGGELTRLISLSDHPSLNFLNDVVVGSDNRVYFTNSSTNFGIDEIKLSVIDHRADGQLLRYDPDSGRTSILVDDLAFPNGISFDPDHRLIYLNEMNNYRILRIDPNTEEPVVSVLANNLPGFPDNLHRGPKNLLWVGVPTPRNGLLDALGPYPILRTMIVRLPAIARPAATRHGMVLAFNPDGTLRYNLQDASGSVAFTAGAVPDNDRIVITSYREPVLHSLERPAP